MRKLLKHMSNAELCEFITDRQLRRKITPKKKPSRITVTSIAQAWNVPEEKLINHILKDKE